MITNEFFKCVNITYAFSYCKWLYLKISLNVDVC